jgi:hypothetical protein
MKTISLLAIILLPYFIIAQDKFDYTVSEPYKVVDAYSKYYFSDKEKGKTLSVKIDGKNIYFQSFDAKSMTETKRERFKDLPKKYTLANVTEIQDKIYFFYTIWSKRDKIQQLWAREIDFDKCQFKGEAKKLFELNERVYFSFMYSQSKHRVLIQCRKRPDKKRDAINYDKIGLYIYDKDLKQLVGNEVKMPYTEQQMDNLDYHVDKEGNPYILAKVRADGSSNNFIGKGENTKINYHLELIKINIKSNSTKITRIKVDKRFIKDIWLYEGADNTMICAGYYNKQGEGERLSHAIYSSNADGFFIFKMNKDGGVKDKNFYEIPVEILNQYEKEVVKKKNKKKEKKNQAEFSNLKIRKLIVQGDNSILLFAEQYFMVTHTSVDSKGNTRTYYSYHYYDMLVTKIGPEGKLAWMRKLPKRQVGTRGRGGMGFKHMSIGGNHYVVFLDNVKNIDLPLNKRPAVHRDGAGGFLTAYSINNETGKVGKVSILNTKDAGGYKLYQFQTGRMLPVSENEFLVEFYKKGKQDLMVKIKVK